jgi:leucyl/phenylalanyl-tRNA---protein transferase
MSEGTPQLPLTWVDSQSPLPPVSAAWGQDSDAPGLLAAGADLGVERLLEAYRQGIFPWFNPDQPVLWWSPDPRMVLETAQFKLHRSLRKTLSRYSAHPSFELCFDKAFDQVIEACAQSPREGQNGTWIVPQMVDAYKALHQAGYAHSAETWLDGQLVAGLYFVCIGKAVFGESMFSTLNDGSKMALAALVNVCEQHGIQAIDCQQNTAHLALMGAKEMARKEFLDLIQPALVLKGLEWKAQQVNWDAWRSQGTA